MTCSISEKFEEHHMYDLRRGGDDQDVTSPVFNVTEVGKYSQVVCTLVPPMTSQPALHDFRFTIVTTPWISNSLPAQKRTIYNLKKCASQRKAYSSHTDGNMQMKIRF
ncbi:Protein of unknown function [Gryllus bimaculatus]|nr:Protein of unknown function [Gryllus bimaculatus]